MAAYVAILIDQFIASGGPFPQPPVGGATARCKVAGELIPTTSLVPESVQWPKKTSWLSLQDGCLRLKMRRRLWQQWRHQCPYAGGSKSVQWTILREQVGWEGEEEHRDKAVAMFARSKQVADNMTRGRGRRGQGKASGKRTTQWEGVCSKQTTQWEGGVGGRREASGRQMTQGSSSRRQKMVEPAHVDVCQCWCHPVSVAVAPGEGGVGCHKPFGPKPGIQHDGRGRGVPTLTSEKKWLLEKVKEDVVVVPKWKFWA